MVSCNVHLNRRHVRREEKQLAQLKHQATECEETSWRLQQELAALDCPEDGSSSARQ
jgi:uncharacterized protein YigA (DUF484 family)